VPEQANAQMIAMLSQQIEQASTEAVLPLLEKISETSRKQRERGQRVR